MDVAAWAQVKRRITGSSTDRPRFGPDGGEVRTSYSPRGRIAPLEAMTADCEASFLSQGAAILSTSVRTRAAIASRARAKFSLTAGTSSQCSMASPVRRGVDLAAERDDQ